MPKRLHEFFENNQGIFSASRLCFIFGTFGLFGLAIAQFLELGELPTALYVVLATMASGGYAIGRAVDGKQTDEGGDDNV